MAVIISNGATTLNTASGFYRAESYNLGGFSATTLALTAARTIPVTFANAGNCMGVIISLGATTHINRTVTVTLQENVASVWTDRVSSVLTGAQIANSVANTLQSTWIRPFEFSVPYAVDTTASKWRFSIIQSGGTVGTWGLVTSNGTAPMYATWCDTAATYALNDVIIAKDRITIDRDCRFNGLLSTGETVNSVCGIACSSNSGDYTANAMIIWENAPVASYTMTIDGYFVFGSHAGFHVGTEASPIPTAQKAVIVEVANTLGTAGNTGINIAGNNPTVSRIGRMNIRMYGEVPSVRSTTLASNAANSQPNIVTSTATGWSIGDSLVVCKADTAGVTAETVPFTISSIAGVNITLNTNIVTAARLAGGHVMRLNGYGVEYKQTTTTTALHYVNGINDIVFSGVWLSGISMAPSQGTSGWYDDTANIGGILVQDCALSNGALTGGVTLFNSTNFLNGSPNVFKRNHAFKASFIGTYYGPASGTKLFEDNIMMNSSSFANFSRNVNVLIDSNYVYNSGGQPVSVGSGLFNSTISNNVFWGLNATVRADGPMMNVIWQNNSHDKITRVFWNFSVLQNVRAINESYGVSAAVSYIHEYFANYVPYSNLTVIDSIIGTVTNPAQSNPEGVDGSKVSFQNYDQVTNADSTYLPYGEIHRAGTGLTDTTVRTAGGFAMRFQPYGMNLMHWEQTIPTGNIQNKTMTISCWVRINLAAYYAGTYTLPTLTVTYDQTSTATSVATATAGSWQQLAVTFTPTTTFGQVEMKITGATNASLGANSYFYVDDFNVAYPAGVQIDLGGLDLWANGLPVEPAIATMPSITGVWDEPLSAHTTAGTMGKILADTEANSDVTQAKVDQL